MTQSKVTNLNVVLLVDQYILRLQVGMNDSHTIVQVNQNRKHLLEPFFEFALLDGFPIVQFTREVVGFETSILHVEYVLLFVFAAVMNSDYIWMI